MKARLVAFLSTMIVTSSIWAFTCTATLLKDSCWSEYAVTVALVDLNTTKTLVTLIAPVGTPWVRVNFECNPSQNIVYTGQFSPVIWESDAGKTYEGIQALTLPAQINPGDKAWTINVCFAADFSDVPLPPSATGNCKCDFKSIPAPDGSTKPADIK